MPRCFTANCVPPESIAYLGMSSAGFATSLGQSRDPNHEASGVRGPRIAVYEPLFKGFYELFTGRFTDFTPGDLARGVARIADVVKREGMAFGKPWAVRVALSPDGMALRSRSVKRS